MRLLAAVCHAATILVLPEATVRVQQDGSSPHSGHTLPDVHAAPGLHHKLRQELTNFEDLQYFSNITVGGQQITGILDTGSFELVVFDSNCTGCGTAGRYGRNRSATFFNAGMEHGQYYGSGMLHTTEAFDLVSIGPFNAVNLSFWDAYSAFMPVLHNARFQSIIGVGPPETPAADAWTQLKRSVDFITGDLEQGFLPAASQGDRIRKNLELSVEMSKTLRMVQALNISTFSVCLGKKPGSAGFFVWNDPSQREQPALFRHIPVMGRHTWTVNMSSVRLINDTQLELPIGCGKGCGAIIDSGTSLLLMPTDAVDMIARALSVPGINCSNMHEFPDLVFDLAGQTFSLPPDAYIADMHDPMQAATSAHWVRFAKKRIVSPCSLAVMESYSETHWGPLWILGMPFFRKYYVSFTLGRSHDERKISIATASPECTPAIALAAYKTKQRTESVHRSYNLSHMFLPTIVRKAASEKFLDL
mmetsp:Transcript_4394/g.12849  ORF Transcript_4394/g.12849 Transcript_4394/m.12849 type:complete len:475 (+) Transcript_4394:55-1479(+)